MICGAFQKCSFRVPQQQKRIRTYNFLTMQQPSVAERLGGVGGMCRRYGITLSSMSITTTLANHECLWAHVFRGGQVLVSVQLFNLMILHSADSLVTSSLVKYYMRCTSHLPQLPRLGFCVRFISPHCNFFLKQKRFPFLFGKSIRRRFSVLRRLCVCVYMYVFRSGLPLTTWKVWRRNRWQRVRQWPDRPRCRMLSRAVSSPPSSGQSSEIILVASPCNLLCLCSHYLCALSFYPTLHYSFANLCMNLNVQPSFYCLKAKLSATTVYCSHIINIMSTYYYIRCSVHIRPIMHCDVRIFSLVHLLYWILVWNHNWYFYYYYDFILSIRTKYTYSAWTKSE